MRYVGRRGAAFPAFLDGILFTAFLAAFFGTLLGAASKRLGDVIVALTCSCLPFGHREVVLGKQAAWTDTRAGS
jgi:hypothetical protein